MQVGSAQMGTSVTYFQDLWPHLPSQAVLHLGHFPFSSWQGSCTRHVGLLWSGASAHPLQLVRGNKEPPQAWRDPRSLQMPEQWPGCFCLLSLTRHGFISPRGFPWAAGMSEAGAAGQGSCLALG